MYFFFTKIINFSVIFPHLSFQLFIYTPYTRTIIFIHINIVKIQLVRFVRFSRNKNY